MDNTSTMRIRSKLFLTLWLVSIGAVVWGSLQPGVELPGQLWNADKVYHLFAYAWLALLPFAVFRVRRAALGAALAMLALGLALELLQSFIPGRYASGNDMLANALGVGLGIGLARSFGNPHDREGS
ncbi:MAG: VanZ family protein [Desulfohalobiaceae bacterium]